MISVAPAETAAALRVQEHGSLQEFVALETEWNALVEATGAEPFLRHECVRAWISSFASEAELVVLTARGASGELVAALPLLLETGRVCGLKARQLVSTADTHSSRFDLIASDPESSSRAFLNHLLGRRGWDLIRIIDVREGGNAWHIHRAATKAGLPVGAWESARSPYLSFPATYDELLASKSSLFRANLRRRRRQLEKRGTLTLERVTEATFLQERLEEGFALESSGWKGQAGSAIALDPKTRAFYGEVAAEAARRGYLSMFFLRLDGRPIAFHYGLVYAGIYYVPKLAYDETLEGCSPGLVLVEDVIKDGIARGLRGYDFLGDEAEWKTKWSTGVRASHWLYMFRDNAVGHALCKAKFDWWPAARRVLRAVEKIGSGR